MLYLKTNRLIDDWEEDQTSLIEDFNMKSALATHTSENLENVTFTNEVWMRNPPNVLFF